MNSQRNSQKEDRASSAASSPAIDRAVLAGRNENVMIGNRENYKSLGKAISGRAQKETLNILQGTFHEVAAFVENDYQRRGSTISRARDPSESKSVLALRKEIEKLNSQLKSYSRENAKLQKEVCQIAPLKKELQETKAALKIQQNEHSRLTSELHLQEKIIKRLNQKLQQHKHNRPSHPKEDFVSPEPQISKRKRNKSCNFYKQLSERSLKESSFLAEQLICLRSDLEKQNIELLKYQKGVNSSHNSSECATLFGIADREECRGRASSVMSEGASEPVSARKSEKEPA